MKHSLSFMTVALLSVALSNAQAASSVDLSVTGLITPAACTPSLSAGEVNHGKISVQDLHPTGPTELPEVTVQLAVNCEASTLMAVRSRDNRKGTSDEPTWAVGSKFGLGLVNGVKIGSYALSLSNALADGVPRSPIESTDGQTWLDAPEGTVWQPDWMRSLSDSSGIDRAPLPMQNLLVDLKVATTIALKRTLPVGQDIPMDGSATLEVVYL